MKFISAKDLFDRLEGKHATIVDVRENNEWLSLRIATSVLIPLSTFDESHTTSLLPTGPLVFVCATGKRSHKAAELATKWGRADVATLEGGIKEWRSEGLPILSTDQSKTSHSEFEDTFTGATTMGEAVATNLSHRRQELGLSLDELAREAGISRTLLGQIELGTATPSINVVWQLAQSLRSPFSSLISNPRKVGTTISKRSSAKKLLSADQRFSSRALHPLNEPTAAEFYEIRLSSHGRQEADAHRVGTQENLIVTSGELELHIGDDVRTLEEGDCITFSADIPHSYVNLSNKDCWMHLVINYLA